MLLGQPLLVEVRVARLAWIEYELVKGDAPVELEAYLRAHPETIVAPAYFDLDLYEPTRKCLETVALQETLGLSRYRIQRSPVSGRRSFLVIE